MIDFGKKFNKIDQKINSDLNSTNKIDNQIAIILKLIMDCQFRVGNEIYSKKNKSYGTTTLEKKHMKIKKNSIEIDFIGKKNVRNNCTVKNKKVVKTLKQRNKKLKNKIDRLFNVSSSDVNNYLKKFGEFSSRNFRTWGANIEFISQILKNCKQKGSYSKSELKKIMKFCIQKVAHKLHNTTTVCKSNYLDPELLLFFEYDYKKFLKLFNHNSNKNLICKNYILFLENL